MSPFMSPGTDTNNDTAEIDGPVNQTYPALPFSGRDGHMTPNSPVWVSHLIERVAQTPSLELPLPFAPASIPFAAA